MKLYHSPGSCSLGIRILLEEIGAPYQIEIIDLKKGDHRSADYLSCNPKGKVPALQRPDGTVLTEFPVIAYWLAKCFAAARLLPEDFEAEVRVMELTEHIVSGLHMRGSAFAMVPQKFVKDTRTQEELRRYGQGVVAEGFATLVTRLAGKPYLFDGFTMADAAAFYLLSWKDRIGIDIPPVLLAYQDRLMARGSVMRALEVNSGSDAV